MDAKEFYPRLMQIDYYAEEVRKRIYRLRNTMDSEKHDVFITYLLDIEEYIELVLGSLSDIKKQVEAKDGCL